MFTKESAMKKIIGVVSLPHAPSDKAATAANTTPIIFFMADSLVNMKDIS